jgi:DNA-directed RNA polymerase subunit RPC12/RpoP
MQKEIEQIKVNLVCPLCQKRISEMWIATLDSIIGIRYAYICGECKNLVRLSKEKFSIQSNLMSDLFSISAAE